MRRYYPHSEPEKNRSDHEGIQRITIRDWHALWEQDRQRWFLEVKDRPKRFDQKYWQRALRSWRNEMPGSVGNGGSGQEGELLGVPFVVKDLYDVIGETTTCSSGVLLSGNGVPAETATRSSWLVERFVDAGAFPAGRSTMNEFAYGLDGRNTYTGDCPHPLDHRRITGGSSSGSAWAVAAGIVPFALGTDTGGSIRLPAALCGIYGVRLSWKKERLRGVFPLAKSFDTVGWLAATPEDTQKLLSVVLPEKIDTERENGCKRIAAVLPPGTELSPEMAELWQGALEKMRSVGLEVDEISPPAELGDKAVDAYNVIGSSEAWDVHREWIGTHGDLYDPVVKGLIERGKHWTTERKEMAATVRQEVGDLAKRLFTEYECVLLPSTVIPTPTYGEADGNFRSQIIRINTFASLAGLPALSVPMHRDAIRSGGLQIVAPADGEGRFATFLDHWNEMLRV